MKVMQITKEAILEVGSSVSIYMAVNENIDTAGGKPFESYVLKSDHEKLISELKSKIDYLEKRLQIQSPDFLNF